MCAFSENWWQTDKFYRGIPISVVIQARSKQLFCFYFPDLIITLIYLLPLVLLQILQWPTAGANSSLMAILRGNVKHSILAMPFFYAVVYKNSRKSAFEMFV